MTIANIFSEKGKNDLKNRVNSLKKDSEPQWGKMNVGQMLAHCNVGFKAGLENDTTQKPNAIARFFIKKFVKPVVVGDKPYSKNSKTAAQFIIKDQRNFETEKERLLNYIDKTFELGEKHFDQKESTSFGVLNKTEWNNMFSKHLDHHLRQFGV